MKRICSVCKKEMGEKEPLDDTRISHSTCPECAEKELAEAKILMRRLKP